MSGKQGKEIRGSVRLGPTLSVARSDELFSLRVAGSLIRTLLLMVITAASHAMCDAELASDWSDVPGSGP